MARRKREPMSEGKKNIIGMLLEEYDIKSAKDIEDNNYSSPVHLHHIGGVSLMITVVDTSLRLSPKSCCGDLSTKKPVQLRNFQHIAMLIKILQLLLRYEQSKNQTNLDILCVHLLCGY